MTDLDILLINPGAGKSIYQNLKNQFSAIEPPAWLAYLSSYISRQKFKTYIFDFNLSMDPYASLQEIISKKKPALICLGIFGQHPSASTQTMVAARKVIQLLKELFPNNLSPIVFIGPHPTALPQKTIQQENIDYVLTGDAFDSTVDLLRHIKNDNISIETIPGLYYKNENGEIESNPAQKIDQNINSYFHDADWGKLDMNKYRAHNWHTFEDINHRSPYAAIYTSLGCPYDCSFCCSNVQYQSPGIRYRDPRLVIDELIFLHKNVGIHHIKIIDELFIFNKKHYIPILEGIIENKLDLNIWAYARVDSIDISKEHLQLLKRAGVNWLALGIESASTSSIATVNKSRNNIDIFKIVQALKDNQIHTIGNFMFGLPNDSKKNLDETYKFSTALNTEYINYYCSLAHPGTTLYRELEKKGKPISDDWSSYAQLSRETAPLPTPLLTEAAILEFRDNAFTQYFNRKEYKNLINHSFGPEVVRHIEEMLQHKLSRNLLKTNSDNL